MNKLNVHKSEGDRSQEPAAEADLLIECGRASTETRGLANMPLYELGVPPYDTTYVGEED